MKQDAPNTYTRPFKFPPYFLLEQGFSDNDISPLFNPLIDQDNIWNLQYSDL